MTRKMALKPKLELEILQRMQNEEWKKEELKKSTIEDETGPNVEGKETKFEINNHT